MTRYWKGERVLSLMLALVLTLSLLPPYALPVYSEENDTADQPLIVTDPGDYSTLIGCNAELNFDYWLNIVISDDPTIAVEDGQDLCATDLLEPVTLVIEECHWVKETCALWLRVDAADGFTLPEKLREYHWVFQNYTDVYEEEDWESFSPDSLLISEPERREPVDIVSDNGVAVSSDYALFTDLIVTETEAPTAHYINKAVAFHMTPRTNEGKYTGCADVTIPIPEGWDSKKVFGFVVEEDGTVTVIPGTVTKFGTFQFTVPHFSEVGLLEATAVEDVRNITIVFGKIQLDKVMDIDGTYGTAGRYVSDDGCVQYVINHVILDGQTKTYVSFTGLDVTDGTEIILSNGVSEISVVVIVEALQSEVTKLLTGGTVTNSAQLDPLYDLGISGDFPVEYSITEGEEYLTLSDNTITAASNTTGNATVHAEVKHPTSGKTVGYVTYNVTISAVEVTDVKRIYVPYGGTVRINTLSGELSNAVNIDETIATAAYNADTQILSITGKADSGETSIVVGNVLLRIYAEPASGNAATQSYLLVNIDENPNCTIYYAINGGELHKLDRNIKEKAVLIGLDENTTQPFPDGFCLMLFGAPDKDYITSRIIAANTEGQFYSLSNGSRYDGSDSDAWPLTDPNAQTIDGGGRVDNLGKIHGLYGALSAGHIDIAGMRNLFTRAIALGCDSVTLFSRDNTYPVDVNMSFIAEKLPTFKKTIVKITRKNNPSNPETYTDAEPYDPTTHAPLEIGDEVTYQFAITITSENIYYWFDIVDDAIGYSMSTYSGKKTTSNSKKTAGTYVYEATYVIGMTDDEVDKEKIQLYANGEFTNTASLSYSYKSGAASGQTETVTTSSVTCRISSIVTWMDNYGTVWSVQNVTHGVSLPVVNNPSKIGYQFDGWDYESAVNTGDIQQNGEKYTVTYTANSSFTILGKFNPQSYDMTFALDGGALPEGVNNPSSYTIEDLITLPVSTKEGHTFGGWLVTSESDSEGNWTNGVVYADGTVLLHRYGNVTLTAQWYVNQYTITFDSDGGSPVAPITQNYGTKITPPVSPTKDEYVFVGWEPVLPDTMPAGNLTLKAVWGSATTTLTIQVADCQSIDENQTFLFQITNQDGLDLTVTVHGNSSVTVDGLTCGKTYTITEISNWSWRYKVASWAYGESSGNGEEAMIKITQTGTITYSHTRDNRKWLDGNSWLEDYFGET